MVRSGDTVKLSCHYDLEGSFLYTIQWFLEETEFYRYVLEQKPPYLAFDVAGIHVNVSIHPAKLANNRLYELARTLNPIQQSRPPPPPRIQCNIWMRGFRNFTVVKVARRPK